MHKTWGHVAHDRLDSDQPRLDLEELSADESSYLALKAPHETLATKENKHHKHMTSSLTCTVCGNGYEDVHHVLI